MSDRLLVVSTDCHGGLPIGDYKPYVDSKYHEMLDMAVPIQVEMMDKAEQQFLIKEINDAWREPIKDRLAGAWDYKQRLNMLAEDGIAAEIIFPDGITEQNTPPFGAGLGLSPKDAVPELQWAGAMAHNRWLAELCANDPKRHIGVASIPLLFDVEQAIEAVRWCVDNGLRAVMLPTLWGEYDAYHHVKYDPFWQVCEELGVIIHFHSGPAPMHEMFGKSFPAKDESATYPGGMGIYVSEVMWWLYRPLTYMIWGGVFERFPKLKCMIVEGGTLFMLPPWLRLLDHNYTDVQFSAKLGDFRSHLSMAPSKYFARNCGIGASCVPRRDLDLHEHLGTRTVMWGSDFPHPEGTWPNTATYYKETFSGFSEDAGRKILGGNAVEFYGLDNTYLRGVADDIGPQTSIFN
ncbi:MAG: amidohydrolase [Gammaproteobacteria bacterium]|nr:amidohydrolase [Gammaproteobacteria bacterium]NND38979.1 amidohydrolase [Pseudomonadales bacterium]MBT8151752.1 amidohydrolase [Gammaproteobacteria bacterium]NNL10639.1 amidohydrolase [Pseudomonadales bacterium]NNM10957.1 amidohydrolase [Pseudomonadales bacterium]